VLVITSGDGLVLDHGKAAHRARLRRLDPYRFSGDWPTQAELSGEPVTDFNVFTRRGKLEAVVQALRLGARSLREPLEARFAFVHVLAGTAVARVTAEETAIELVAGDSLRIDDSTGGDELDLGSRSDATELIVVRICG
jgi:environmental stress-induced protein Ves